MIFQGFKLVGAGLAKMFLGGAGVGIGRIFWGLWEDFID